MKKGNVWAIAAAVLVILASGCKKETLYVDNYYPEVVAKIQGHWVTPFKGVLDTATCSIDITFSGNAMTVRNTSLTPTNFDYKDNFVILNDTMISLGEGNCSHLPYRYSLSDNSLTLGSFDFTRQR